MPDTQNNFITRSHASHPKLTTMKIDPEPIVRKWANPSFRATIGHAKPRYDAMQEPKESRGTALAPNSKGVRFNPIPAQDRALTVNPFIFDLAIAPELKRELGKMDEEI